MFTEYLSQSHWQAAIPGVLICFFSDLEPGPLPRILSPEHLEIFFCTGGMLSFQTQTGPADKIQKQDFLLFSDCSDLKSAEIVEPLSGFCVCIDRVQIWQLCEKLQDLLLFPSEPERIDRMLHTCGGEYRLANCEWSRSLFSVLQYMSEEEQGRYCSMKTLELLYLMSIKSAALKQVPEEASPRGYLENTVSRMRSYMEDHLDQKLTIPVMSSRFHISPTAFKSCFRSLYGQPVHSWLLQRRMEKASVLLRSSDMTVLQVAQEVGYDGSGQFHVAFRQRYGMTPNAYRKLSHSKHIQTGF